MIDQIIDLPDSRQIHLKHECLANQTIFDVALIFSADLNANNYRESVTSHDVVRSNIGALGLSASDVEYLGQSDTNVWAAWPVPVGATLRLYRLELVGNVLLKHLELPLFDLCTVMIDIVDIEIQFISGQLSFGWGISTTQWDGFGFDSYALVGLHAAVSISVAQGFSPTDLQALGASANLQVDLIPCKLSDTFSLPWVTFTKEIYDSSVGFVSTGWSPSELWERVELRMGLEGGSSKQNKETASVSESLNKAVTGAIGAVTVSPMTKASKWADPAFGNLAAYFAPPISDPDWTLWVELTGTLTANKITRLPWGFFVDAGVSMTGNVLLGVWFEP